MKSILQKLIGSIAVVLMTAISVYAQVPQGFNFQAIARDANGEILANTQLGVQVSLVKGAESENPLYQESHSVTTNPLGLIQIVIGEGTAGEGQVFSAIDFGNDNYFVKLGIDVAGGTDYADLGITRLLSVPYALVAQKAVEGSGSGDFSLDLGLNTTGPDTSFVINIEGDKTAKPFQVFSSSSGYNGAVWGEAKSEDSNPNNQRGVLGIANGEGTGSHIGVFGSTVNYEATGQNRLGLYGQAASKAKFNYGAQALAQGDGSGDVVQIGEEVDGNFGSFNIAGGFYSQGNLNGNIGVEGIASGDKGARVNIGVEGGARAAANSRNLGVSAYAQNSLLENIAFLGRSESGSARNVGMKLFVNNGLDGANVGAEIFADTAAILHGKTVINGDLIVNGNFNGSGGGSANGQVLDSLFVSTPPEAEYQRNTSFYPGFIRNNDQDGNFVNLSRRALQYGDTESDGTGNVFNWFSKGGMQVANNDYLNGERSAGMSGGYFYMDIAQNDNFYLPLEFGISNATEGGRSFFRMNSLARAENQLGPLYSIDVSNDPNGSDPDGESAQIFLHGDNTPNFQFGGQSWNNNELAFLNMYGSTSDGNGWYYNNAYLSVGSDGIDEWGSLGLSKTNITGQTSQETILLNGQNGNINIAGTLNQSSDERLKKDIKTLDNALERTIEMRGVSYNWKTDAANENPQIGVIAQEVEKIYPEFVRTDEGGMKSVNYAQMTAVLIEAVKELNTEIQELKSNNATLQAKIDTQNELGKRLAKIEALLNLNSSVQGHLKNSTRE